MNPGDEIVVSLADLGLGDRGRVGAKAAVLGELSRRGLPVPGGFVVLDPERWAEATMTPGPGCTGRRAGEVEGRWIVRSSAAGEDGASASFAGQLESVLDVPPGPSLVAAVNRVSSTSERAREYARAHGQALAERIPVLVQRQLDVARAGVLFTVDPSGRDRMKFAVDWGGSADVTDGRSGSNARVFDPFRPDLAGIDDPVVARALPRLTELAFSASAVLGWTAPLDIEWVVDAEGVHWIVQARPVTAYDPAPEPEVERLLAEDFHFMTPRPVSTLAACSFLVADRVDRRAARWHHAHFERKVVGPWLLARRVKSRRRGHVEASSAPAFFARWIWRRRRNLAFGLLHLLAWRRTRATVERSARRAFCCDLPRLPRGRLRRLLAGALVAFERARASYAALRYPVDLIDDVVDFEKQFRCEGLSAGLPRPARRVARDRERARLVLELRVRSGGEHPRWEALGAADREEVVRHLARHPYAFASKVEVQDLAAWRSWVEAPREFWEQQAYSTREELERCVATPAGRRTTRGLPLATRLVGWLLCLVVGRFAPLKDDRVEVFALACAASRWVLIEIERRAGAIPGPVLERGWIFELSPGELLGLAAAVERPERVRLVRAVAIARFRRRALDGFSVRRRASAPARAAPGPASGLELRGASLSRGTAVGPARVVESADEAMRLLQPGEVIVLEELRPAFTGVMARASALVCRRGSPLCHGAIIARELGIPAVSLEELGSIRTGARVLVDGERGCVRVLGEA